MTLAGIDYPQQHSLFTGALLGSIAHAVFVAKSPDFSHEQSWDGYNYSVQDSAGSRGTVAFSTRNPAMFVAVFFLESSNRNPFRSNREYQLEPFLRGIPEELRPLADSEALQYVLQEYQGRPTPIITAAFWSDGRQQRAVGAESWRDIFGHGACLIQNQLLPTDAALSRWQTEYDFSARETNLVRVLYERKLRNFDSLVSLQPEEVILLKHIAASSEGFETSKESFSEIRVAF